MDWPLAGGGALVGLGFLSAASGVLFGVLPGLPGPPLAMLAPVLVVGGVMVAGATVAGWGWGLLAVILVLGLVVTVLDLLAPVLGRKLGGGGHGAMWGAYFGLGIAVGLGLHIGSLGTATSLVTFGLGLVAGALVSLAALVLGPLLGGMVGELCAQPAVRTASDDRSQRPLRLVVWDALATGLAQCLGLLVTTGAKVVYGLVSLAACAALVLGWLL